MHVFCRESHVQYLRSTVEYAKILKQEMRLKFPRRTGVSPSTWTPLKATISASSTTLCFTCITLISFPCWGLGERRPSARRTMSCTACLSWLESRLLLLKIDTWDELSDRTSTWIWARSPSYLVSAQILSEPRSNSRASAQPKPFSDFGIWC